MVMVAGFATITRPALASQIGISSLRSSASVGFCLCQGGVVPLALLAAGLGVIVVAVAAAVTVAVDTGFFGSAVTAAFCSGACPSGQMRNTLFLSGTRHACPFRSQS
jgi:hypothetical protein